MSVHRAFKSTERAVAKLLGGKRLGHLGGVDVSTPWVAAEVKHRKSLPDWLTSALAQAVRHAQPEQLPIVVLHIEGQRHTENLVMIRLGDFQQWFGDMGEAEIVEGEDHA